MMEVVQQFKKYKLLLLVTLLLVVIKFIIVPIFNWQSVQISKAESQQLRLIKANSIIAQKESFILAADSARESLRQYKDALFDSEKINGFKIDKQKEISSYLKENNLTLLNIGWQPELQFLNAQLHREQVRLNIGGETHRVAQFIYFIENHSKLVSVEQLSFNIRGLTTDESGTAEASLLISFYFNQFTGDTL
ncbi:hypothetical protein J8L98_03885 [Pseudoalteromonas sp. MMG013]|uniref:hypothetical protein n=1 Tax=Pseudoalteromonas sp. MMG013 TaxID=2822687 RepID=UPI001B39370C|nr:hypothetical protein [Pseudoalteromonas sp. MMG013]MBQ4860836.1 hypothetical protein [Pseudoalteromonas sp. MMG013]